MLSVFWYEIHVESIELFRGLLICRDSNLLVYFTGLICNVILIQRAVSLKDEARRVGREGWGVEGKWVMVRGNFY